MRFDIRHRIYMFKSKLPYQVAGMLPKWLVYYAVIRMWAKATVRDYPDRSPGEVNLWDALKAWQTNQ